MSEDNQEIFIDQDAPYSKENSFEQEVLRQMRRCIDVLSQEVVGGTMKVRVSKSGQKEEYIEDVRELIINSVDTFRILMKKWFKDSHKKGIEKIQKEIKEFKNSLGEKRIIIPRKGIFKVNELGIIEKQNLIWKELTEFKAEKYREMFEILVNVYTTNKDEIKAWSIE